jgi:drug/metabolite transporter (DMT)-like permease
LSQSKGTFLVILSAIFFSTEAIFSKLAYTSGVNFLSTITFRSAFVSLLLLAVMLLINQGLKVPKASWKLLGLLMVIFNTIGTCLFKAIEILPASLAILFFYSFPAFTCLFDYLIKGEKLSRTKLLALVLAFCGLTLLHFSSIGRLPLLGVFFAFSAALANSLFMVLSPLLLQKVHELTVTFWLFISGAVFYLIIGGVTGSLAYDLPIQGWIYLILLSVISTAAANITLIYGLGVVGSTTAAIVQTLEPVVTAVLAFLVFDERLHGWQVLGAILIVTAVLIPHLKWGVKAVNLHEVK